MAGKDNRQGRYHQKRTERLVLKKLCVRKNSIVLDLSYNLQYDSLYITLKQWRLWTKSFSKKYYNVLFLISTLLLLCVIVLGGFYFSDGNYARFTAYLALAIVLAISIVFFTSKYYKMEFLPVKSYDLIDDYEKTNTRFLSTNSHFNIATSLSKKLFEKSNKFIYIYTGRYNAEFYSQMKDILEQKKNASVVVEIIAEQNIENKDVIPKGSVPLEKHKIGNLAHFIVTDYGLRYESSDICNKDVEGIFALNIYKAKGIEPTITAVHTRLKTAFERNYGL